MSSSGSEHRGFPDAVDPTGPGSPVDPVGPGGPADAADPVGPVDTEAGHRRALVLSEVAVEGAIGLYRVLRRAASGDRDAADLSVASLVHALPGVGAYDTHDLLALAHIPPTLSAGALTPGQRVALATQLDRAHPAEPL